MITSNLYSMSVKELVTRLSVLLVVCAFAVSAKAGLTVVKRATNKYTVVVDAADQIKNWTLPDSLSEIVDLRIETTSGVQLSKAEVEKLCNQGPGNNNFLPTTLKTLDFSTAELKNVNKSNIDGPEGNPLKVLNDAPSNIKNFVFPVQNGMFVPTDCFAGNQNIESVVIPDYPSGSTYTLGSSVFARSSLKKVGIGKGTTSLGGAASEDVYDSNGSQMFSDCSQLYSVVLNDDITCIKNMSFSGCSNLEFVKLPNSIRIIGGNAFLNCTNMKTVVIPESMSVWGGNVFAGMPNLTDVYLLGSNIPLPFAGDEGGTFNVKQTTNFRYKGENDPNYEPTYSAQDYRCTDPNDNFPMAILHYPATDEAVANYRWSGATSNNLIDPDGTTWPDAEGINNFWTAKNDFPHDNYRGWKFFLQGVQNEKRDDIVPDSRYKESRWYSVCYPFDVTEDKFYSAFGPRAALSEFSGMEIDEKNNMTLKFTQAAVKAPNDVILKKNHAYMIHPDKICTDEEPITIYNVINELEHYRHSSVVGTLRGLETRLEICKQQIAEHGETENYNQTVVEQLEHDIETEHQRLHALDILTDEEVDEYNDNYNATVWDHTKTAAADEETTESRIHRFPDRDNINFYFKGNYLDNVPLPAYSYYLGGSLANNNYGFYFRKKEGSTWTRFTAILVPEVGTTPTGAKGVGFDCWDDAEIVNEDGNAATAIDSTIYVKIPLKKTGNAYNMQGQMVGTNGTNGLAKGIYIVNGKKVVVK